MPNKNSDKICEKLHRAVNALPRFLVCDNKTNIPKNGIYFLFQQGETAHNLDRIVRIGTHIGHNKLKSRLIEHFVTPNKNKSIFRKHIGRCLLANDDFLHYWNKKANNHTLSSAQNTKKQKMIEQSVTDYIQYHFTFSVINMNTKQSRLHFEKKFLSTCHACSVCVPSDKWLGLKHQNKIIHKGLWNIQGLNGNILSTADFNECFD